MRVVLIALAVVSVLELLLYVPPIWRLRDPFSVVILLLLAVVSGALFGVDINMATAMLLLVGLYRMFNLLRIVEGRMEPHFLRRVIWRTSGWLIGFQLIILGLWRLGSSLNLSWRIGLGVVSGLQLLLASSLLVTTLWQLRRSRPIRTETSYADRDLPTVSICIPARNETQALEMCLTALVASDYPKLEILVLDDCSQDNTSDVIRSFAHAGVRFIKGVEPESAWLAKNWAYQQLYTQASGDLLLFCGVDVRMERASLRQFVTQLLAQNHEMAAVMPLNQQRGFGSRLLQPLRYGWELSLPRTLVHRPPVLSTCWLARRTFLHKSGGFGAVTHSILPESYFARLATQSNGYSFLRSERTLAITSQKAVSEQWQTAARTRYPQIHRRPEILLLLTMIEIVGIVASPFLFVGSLIAGQGVVAILAGCATLLFSVTYTVLIRATYGYLSLLALGDFVPAVLLDIWVRHYSMVQYEFAEVTWKGRNVCLPVMHSSSKLLKDQ